MKLSTVLTLVLGAVSAELVWLPQDKLDNAVPDFVEFSDQTTEIDFVASVPKTSYWDSLKTLWKNERRPYSGVHQAGMFTWTAIDGKQPEIIQFLAKNPEMFKRLCEQNRYVLRRQFVYVNEGFDQISKEIYSGDRKELKLPGFDGEQLTVVVDNFDHEISEGVSAWNGHLADKPDSTVIASTAGSDFLHIEVHLKDRQVRYEAREQDEWIIQEIDLEALRESTLVHAGREVAIHTEESSNKRSYRVLATQ